MLKHRLIFGTIMFAALLALIHADDRVGRLDITGTLMQSFLFGQPHLAAGLVLFVVLLLITALGARELADLFIAKGVQADRTVMMLSAVVGLAVMYLAPREAAGGRAMPWAMTGLVIAFILGMGRHACRMQTEGAMAAGGAAVFAAVYLGVFPGFLLLLRADHSAWLVAAIIMITKACDIGAYTAGRLFGKHKLIPWLSPGKTWEGLAGGAVLCVAVAMALAAMNNHFAWAALLTPAGAGDAAGFTHRDYSLAFAALLGLLLAVIGHAGDLLESLLKRDAGAKDSGSTIPGFGGVLDVIDSPLFIAPVAYWMMQAA
jgi:phosphatidate cytidylyltransferase